MSSSFAAQSTAPACLVTAYALLDSLRRAQGEALAGLGLGARECPYSVVASDPLWRLREYGATGSGPPLIIVTAPIKRPYIWDLMPAVSAIRQCRRRGLRLFLLEWQAASHETGKAGLGAYADRSIGAAVREVRERTGGARPFLMGHSLGATFIAIYAALSGENLSGLVLLNAPLCFAPGSSRFRDALVSLVPESIAALGVLPGSLLSQICVTAAPDVFLWSRALDAGLSLGDLEASTLHGHVERWALDELPLAAALVGEIFTRLYRENLLCSGRLEIGGRPIGPAALRLPVLAVMSTADEIAPPASLKPFIDAARNARWSLLQHEAEVGVALQHLAVLIGRKAHALIWPQVVDWLLDQARGVSPEPA